MLLLDQPNLQDQMVEAEEVEEVMELLQHQSVKEIHLQLAHHKVTTEAQLMVMLMLIQVQVAVDQLQLEEHLRELEHQEVQVEQEHQIQ